MSTEPIKVLCVDDSPDIASLLHAFIEAEPGLESAGCVSDAGQLLAEVKRSRPDIVILDLSMPGHDPLVILEEINREYPDTRTIVYSGYDDPENVNRAVDAGAWGYLSKDRDMAELVDAIRRVARGELVLEAK
jgi:DNA-binding NarL/FixJ family response regulator